MKKAMSTITGKTFLFLLCTIMALLVGLSSILALYMVEEEFYTRSKEELYSRIVIGRLRSDLCERISDLNDPASFEGDGRIVYALYDEEDHLIASCKDYSEKGDDLVFTYHMEADDSGNIVSFYYGNRHDEGADTDLKQYRLKVCILPGNENDFYSFVRKALDLLYPLRYGIFALIVFFAISFVVSFVALLSVSGRRNKDDGLYPGPLNAVPFDVLVTLFLGSVLLCLVLFDQGFNDDVFSFACVFLFVLYLIVGTLALSMSAAVRIKQKSLFRNTLIWKAGTLLFSAVSKGFSFLKRSLKWFLSLIRQIPLVYKSALFLFLLCFLELLFFAFTNYEVYGLFRIIEMMILIPFALYVCLKLLALKKGGRALAEGDLSYQVDTKGMFWDLKEHGRDLNEIGKGMAIAVEDRLKSERMKTELITNVSHDIKTPLTSIINYADLISKEETKNRKTKEYCDVLVRQSEKLKRLLEDLVEASKASSGNLEVDMMPLNASIFVQQSAGEYEERLEKAGLKLVTSLPEEEITIMADGRRMWRIFDNLMNNILKYGQSDTRVYLSLKKEDGNAVFVFRNTSRDELNISPEELMERFTRGDSSRNSEGNGLGLSIARSLTELQNGKMELDIDGDLFKVTLSFPAI